MKKEEERRGQVESAGEDMHYGGRMRDNPIFSCQEKNKEEVNKEVIKRSSL